MAGGSFKIEGLRELEDLLAALPESTGKGVTRRVATKALEPMRDAARKMAPDDPKTPNPKDSLDLGNSIKVSRRQKTGGAKRAAKEGPHSVEVHMGPTKDGYPQAIFMEFGTFKDAAQPYMRPAFDAHGIGALDYIGEELGRAIRKTIARRARRAPKRAGG